MPHPPARSPLRPGDLLVSPTRGGAGYHVERIIDPRRESWTVWHVGFATTEAEALELARRARAEPAIWLRPDIAVRRARKVG